MFKKVGKVVVDVYSIRFCHFYHRVYDSTCLCPIWCVAEQPVFPPYSKWANSVFTKVIGKAASAIFKVSCKIGAAVFDIGNCFIHSGSAYRVLFIKPRQKAFYYRLFFFKTSLLDSIEGSLFRFDHFFHMKKLIDIHDSLYRRLGVIQFFPFGNGVCQIPADMCPTSCSLCIWDLIVAAVSVAHQVSS